MTEKKHRSMAKMVTWRIVATTATMSLVFFLTGRLDLSVTVGFLEVLLKMILYYSHERAWNKIRWGKL